MAPVPTLDRSAYPEPGGVPDGDMGAAIHFRVAREHSGNFKRLARDVPLQPAHSATMLQGEFMLLAQQQTLADTRNPAEHDDARVRRGLLLLAARFDESAKDPAWLRCLHGRHRN